MGLGRHVLDRAGALAKLIADGDRVARLLHARQPSDIRFASLNNAKDRLNFCMRQHVLARDRQFILVAELDNEALQGVQLLRFDRGSPSVKRALYSPRYGADRDAD